MSNASQSVRQEALNGRMSREEFLANLAEIGRLKAEVKRRCMIFNCDGKERAARFYGLPLDSFHELAFAQWVDVDRHYAAAVRSES